MNEKLCGVEYEVELNKIRELKKNGNELIAKILYDELKWYAAYEKKEIPLYENI